MSEPTIAEIGELYEQGYTQQAIADQFGINQRYVSCLIQAYKVFKQEKEALEREKEKIEAEKEENRQITEELSRRRKKLKELKEKESELKDSIRKGESEREKRARRVVEEAREDLRRTMDECARVNAVLEERKREVQAHEEDRKAWLDYKQRSKELEHTFKDFKEDTEMLIQQYEWLKPKVDEMEREYWGIKKGGMDSLIYWWNEVGIEGKVGLLLKLPEEDLEEIFNKILMSKLSIRMSRWFSHAFT